MKNDAQGSGMCNLHGSSLEEMGNGLIRRCGNPEEFFEVQHSTWPGISVGLHDNLSDCLIISFGSYKKPYTIH